MKSLVITSALVLFAAFSTTQVNAQSVFSRSENTLISFNAGKYVAPNARVIIRNSAGQVVRSKNIYGAFVNVESSLFASGAYSYTIINGSQKAEGSFLVR